MTKQTFAEKFEKRTRRNWQLTELWIESDGKSICFRYQRPNISNSRRYGFIGRITKTLYSQKHLELAVEAIGNRGAR